MVAERLPLPVTLGIYRRLLGARIRADWQYRTSFLLYLTGQAVAAAADFAAIAVLFTAVDELAGWSGAEVACLYGLSGLAFGLADLFISPLELSTRHIKAGTFDQFLIRPVGIVWQLLAMEFATRRLGRSIQPAITLSISLAVLDISWTPAAVLMVVLSVLCGMVIYGTFWALAAAMAFWTVETQEMANALTYGGNLLTSYPIDILGGWLRRFVTFVVPLASIAYLPTAWLVGKPMPFGMPAAVAWTGPLVAAAAVVLAHAVWGQAIRHYQSTGS